MEPSFSFYFNKKRQTATVYMYDVHPNTFARWDGGRWGYFNPEWKEPQTGHFGSLHFVRGILRVDTIYHELDHLRAAWIWANRNAWTGRNEEGLIETMDKMFWNFMRELRKVEPKAGKWMKPLSEL